MVQGKVKEKAFELRKVRGEVNPADLFTKHLASKDRVHNLTELFGCSFRSGRSDAAPLLRKKDDAEKDGFGDLGNDGDLDCDLFDADFEDAKLHDADTLPHSYCQDDLDHLFPIIHAADAEYDLLDWNPEDIYYGPEFIDSLGATARVGPDRSTSTAAACLMSTTMPAASTSMAPVRSVAGASVGELHVRTPATASEADASVGELRGLRGGRHATGARRPVILAARVGESSDDPGYVEARGRRAERDATPVASCVGEQPCRHARAAIASDAPAFRQSLEAAQAGRHRRAISMSCLSTSSGSERSGRRVTFERPTQFGQFD